MRKYESVFFVAYGFFFVLGSVTVLLIEHGDAVVWINEAHTPALDIFFKYTTYLGDGIALAVAAVVLLIYKLRYGLILGLLGIVQAIVSYFMKRVVFGKTPRPSNFFEDLSGFHFVEGVELHGWNSLPSGHTMTAFSIAAFFVYFLKNVKWSIVLLLLAILAGISRIYLFQHFLIDVVVGSLVGVLLAFAASRIFRKYLSLE